VNNTGVEAPNPCKPKLGMNCKSVFQIWLVGMLFPGSKKMLIPEHVVLGEITITVNR